VQWSAAVIVTAPHVDGFCQLSATTISEEFTTFGISVVLTVNIVNENQTIDDAILRSIRRVGRSESSSLFRVYVAFCDATGELRCAHQEASIRGSLREGRDIDAHFDLTIQ